MGILNIETHENGRAKRGTFTTTIEGVRVYTPTAAFYLAEAFLIEKGLGNQVMNASMEFSDETKQILSDRYGIGLHPMITGDVDLSERLNDSDMQIQVRTAAFAIYENLASLGW